MEDRASKGDQMTDESTVVDVTTDDQDVQEPDSLDAATDSDSESESEPDTFDRAYVEKLRQENGKYRQRAQRADDLAHRLHRALVEQTGKLADASDLPFDETHLDYADKMVAAIDELVGAKPHLAARRIAGDIGQGASKPSDGVNLLNILRGN